MSIEKGVFVWERKFIFNKDNQEHIGNEIWNCKFAGCIEKFEQIFGIVFASGMKDGEPVYLTLEEERQDRLEEFDGKVDYSIPPMSLETKKPLKEKVKFYYRETTTHFRGGSVTKYTAKLNGKIVDK